MSVCGHMFLLCLDKYLGVERGDHMVDLFQHFLKFFYLEAIKDSQTLQELMQRSFVLFSQISINNNILQNYEPQYQNQNLEITGGKIQHYNHF